MTKRYGRITIDDPQTGETTDVSPRIAARWTGRSVRTAQRWAAGRSRPAPADVAAMHAQAFGILPDDRWRGFRLRGGALVCLDTGETWTAAQLRASWILFQMAADWRRQYEEQRPGRRGLRLIRAGVSAEHVRPQMTLDSVHAPIHPPIIAPDIEQDGDSSDPGRRAAAL